MPSTRACSQVESMRRMTLPSIIRFQCHSSFAAPLVLELHLLTSNAASSLHNQMCMWASYVQAGACNNLLAEWLLLSRPSEAARDAAAAPSACWITDARAGACMLES